MRLSVIGAHNWCGPAKANSISDSTPAALAIRQPDALSRAYSSSVVLPMPASPRRTRTELWPPCTVATSWSSVDQANDDQTGDRSLAFGNVAHGRNHRHGFDGLGGQHDHGDDDVSL
ncbi:hypothetical protein [Nonomuraea sp. NPDC050786]|uniref:hypothetical protein n=1 Tax=Nonomuraea sp. NPDC050786 TaxID=3154840 RepID=UPI0033ECC48F